MRDRSVLSRITYCATCNTVILKPKRKCMKCIKRPTNRVTVLKSSRARPRTLALGKAQPNHRFKRPKRQNPASLGNVPVLRTSGN